MCKSMEQIMEEDKIGCLNLKFRGAFGESGLPVWSCFTNINNIAHTGAQKIVELSVPECAVPAG